MTGLGYTVCFTVFSLLLTLNVTACSGGAGGSLPANAPFGGASNSTAPQALPVTSEAITNASSANSDRNMVSTVRALDATTGEQAQSSDQFVDSIGVNTHMNWGVYSYNLPAFTAALRASGIRHIREAFQLRPSAQYMSSLQSLAASGIHAMLGAQPNDDPKAIASFVGNYVPSIEALENPNEPNPQYGVWAPALRTFIKDLYTAVKSNPTSAKYPVYAPPLHDWPNQNPWATLGDVSAYVDYGNIHDYSGGYVPTDTSIDSAFAKMNLISGSKPVVATENGYSTATASNGLPMAIDMAYTIRMLFKQFQRGFHRTWIYEFLDDGTDPGNYWNQAGLLTNSFQPKPAYTAVQSSIALLADPGATTPQSKLAYSLAGDTTHLMHVLLQKNDGTFYLAMWLNISDFNVSSKSVLTPAAQQVSLTFGMPVTSMSDYRFDDAGKLASSPVALTSATAQLNLTDRVQIFEIVPGNARRSASPTPVPSSAPMKPAPVLANTAAHWGLDEGAGRTAADSVGPGTAILSGNASWTKGMFGSAIAMPDGSHLTATAGLLDTSQSYSVAAWLLLQDASMTRSAVAIQGNQRSAFHLGFIQGRGFGFEVYAADTASHTSVRASQSTAPTLGMWYHVAGVYDKPNCRITLYVNGTFIKNVAGCTTFQAHGATEFGRGLLDMNEYPNAWSGAIDEVNLYQRALSQAEVATLSRRP